MTLLVKIFTHSNLSSAHVCLWQLAGLASIRLRLGIWSVQSVPHTATPTRRGLCTASVTRTTSVRMETLCQWPVPVCIHNCTVIKLKRREDHLAHHLSNVESFLLRHVIYRLQLRTSIRNGKYFVFYMSVYNWKWILLLLI